MALELRRLRELASRPKQGYRAPCRARPSANATAHSVRKGDLRGVGGPHWTLSTRRRQTVGVSQRQPITRSQPSPAPTPRQRPRAAGLEQTPAGLGSDQGPSRPLANTPRLPLISNACNRSALRRTVNTSDKIDLSLATPLRSASDDWELLFKGRFQKAEASPPRSLHAAS